MNRGSMASFRAAAEIGVPEHLEEPLGSPDPATYTHDGYPTNLAAAAMDAQEWLSEYRRSLVGVPAHIRNRLDRAMEYLDRFLEPHRPMVFLEKPEEESDERHR